MNHNLCITSVISLLAGLMIVTPVQADTKETQGVLRKTLIDDASTFISLRYRYEMVDQDGLPNNAKASTLRTKLGYKTGTLNDFRASLEIENVSYAANDNFNNTLNGKGATHPTIADPDSTEINHAFVTYSGFSNTIISAGRQPHNLDNQRFIGTVGWRQNDQSYDSIAISNTSLPHLKWIYSYVDNVNRIFSDDHPNGDLDVNAHIINAAYTGLPVGTLTAYSYWLDIEDQDLVALSSKTIGLRLSGKRQIQDKGTIIYTAEYAVQHDHGDNPVDYAADYYFLEAGAKAKGLTVKLGYETLGSDNAGSVAFQTPLATGHAFNGWADKFLTTPATGLTDISTSLLYKFSNANIEYLDGAVIGLVYHDFSADSGGADYGTELDAIVKKTFFKRYKAVIKYADYSADSYATDSQKLWLQLGAKF